MDKNIRKRLLKQFVDNSPEDLAKIKAEAEAALTADANRQDARDIIAVMTELLTNPPEQGQSSREDLVAENTKLKARIAELEAAQSQAAEDEEIIRLKMARGLNREQAVQVIARQREFDAKKAAGAKKGAAEK